MSLLRSRELWVVTALVAVAALLRFTTLSVQSFWLDEAVTVSLVDSSLLDMLSRIPDSESTPPLYYVLAWLWTRVFGTSEVGIRSLSAAFGTATIPVLYLAARQLVNRRTAVIAGALAALSPLLVWYSQEARAYALLALLGSLSFLLFVRALDRPSGARLAVWALVSALAVGTHYFAALLIAPEAAWLLVNGWRQRAPAGDGREPSPGAAASGLRLELAAIVPVGAVGFALLPLAIDQRSNGGDFITESSSLPFRLAQVPKQFLTGFEAPAETLLALLAVGLTAVALLLLLTRTTSDELRGAAIAAVVGAAAIGLSLLLAVIGFDYLITRNVIEAWGPLTIVVAAGFAASRARFVGLAGALALCGLSLAIVVAVDTEPRHQRDDWRGAAEALETAHADRAVVVTPDKGRIPMQLYLDDAHELGAAGAAVREIDLVGMAAREPGEALVLPPATPSQPPPPGFSLTETRRTDSFIVLRYASNSPLAVTPDQISALKLGTQPATVLIQAASSP